ncbi:MAG: tyrosine-type recombinase/integrase, partial [Longimicrobiales bacterium]
LLRRALIVEDVDGVRYADRRVASLTRTDCNRILDELRTSARTGKRIIKSTRDKNRKILQAWMNYELLREQDRAEDQGRKPLFAINVFSEKSSSYSKPTKDGKRTVADVTTRRFFPDEMCALISAARGMWYYILVIARRLGLRPGELPHLRWMEDVFSLENGRGYVIDIQGGRTRDVRCGCRQCRSQNGWSPKNGPRRYFLDREHDRFGWITEVCDALDGWLQLRNPSRGDLIFPDPSDWRRAMSNQKLNSGLHDIATRVGIVTGLSERGGRTFHSLRHTCASELLEAGVTHPHAAYWIGDTLDEFTNTYGRPTDEGMVRAIFGRDRDAA